MAAAAFDVNRERQDLAARIRCRADRAITVLVPGSRFPAFLDHSSGIKNFLITGFMAK